VTSQRSWPASHALQDSDAVAALAGVGDDLARVEALRDLVPEARHVSGIRSELVAWRSRLCPGGAPGDDVVEGDESVGGDEARVRLEVGAREIAEGQLTYTRRDLGKEGKKKVSVDEFLSTIESVLTQMQADMLERARKKMNGMITDIKSLKEMRDFFAADKLGGVRLDYALIQNSAEFDAIKKEFSVTPRCLPFENNGQKVIVAKAY